MTVLNQSKLRIKIIDGRLDMEHCFAVSSMGHQVLMKSPKANFLEVVDVCDTECNVKKKYFIDQKYVAKRWLHVEKINETEVLALLESESKWWLVTFLLDKIACSLVKLHRSSTFRLRQKTTTVSVKCHREGTKVRYMIIQASAMNDKKYCSVLECQVGRDGEISKGLKVFPGETGSEFQSKLNVPESAWWYSQLFEIRRRLHFISDSKRDVIYQDNKSGKNCWRKQPLCPDFLYGYPTEAAETPVEWADKLWIWNTRTATFWTLDLRTFQWRQVMDINLDNDHGPKAKISLRILPNGLAFLHGHCLNPFCEEKAHVYIFDLNEVRKNSLNAIL
uniref:F-box associated domain-containing protein n=2 Tax=Plectus sambesii TaxID=2011161 RepID=A0A914VZX6_9BILA